MKINQKLSAALMVFVACGMVGTAQAAEHLAQASDPGMGAGVGAGAGVPGDPGVGAQTGVGVGGSGVGVGAPGMGVGGTVGAQAGTEPPPMTGVDDMTTPGTMTPGMMMPPATMPGTGASTTEQNGMTRRSSVRGFW
ncbi:MAG TPA: hypothetical protein V6C52_14285 [Coleofasciculaceae cyanobacterium]|jgi:hypothetical protein